MELNFFTVLCLIFITLKLTNTIDWSWWWVLSPIWLPIVVVLGLGLLFMCLAGLLTLLKLILGV